MNKRIKELMQESGLQPYYDAQEAQIENFAKMIVSECLDMMAQRQYEGIDELWSVDETMMKATIDIVEHFGIEE